MYFALIAAGVILAGFAIIGIKQGLVKVLFSMLAGVAIIVLTLIFAPKVTPWLMANTDWDEGVYTACENYLTEIGVVVEAAPDSADSDEDSLSEALDRLPLAQSFIKELKGNVEEYLAQGRTAWNTYVTEKVSTAVFNLMVYIGMFIAMAILVLIVWLILNGLSKLPGFKEVNRVGGFFVGLAQGVLVLWVIMMILAIIFNNGGMKWLSDQITASEFLNFIYTHNPLMILLFAIAGIS